MKKTLIASAVAAATLSSTAFAMDPATDLAERLDSMPEFYGNIQLYYLNQETDTTGAQAVSTNSVQDGGSTLGLKHSHAISDGLTGFFKAEYEYSADENASGPSGFDEAYMGVKGDFGAVQIGNDDTVYEWVDVIDNSEQVGISGELADDDERENIQYTSPTIADMLTVGVTLPTESDDEFGGALAAKASLEMVDIIAAYGIGRTENGVEGGSAYGLAASVGLDDLTINVQYEARDADTNKIGGLSTGAVDTGQDTNLWGLQGIYAMGANTFRLGYAMQTWDQDTQVNLNEIESSTFELAALHSLSDHMYVFLEYAMTTTEVTPIGGGATSETDVDSLAIGAAYSF